MSSLVETNILKALRARYEAEGYTFIVAPGPSLLPPFLGGYRPDAIAQKAGRNIVIEVKTPHAQMHNLREIRRRLDGHPDWLLNVVAAGRGSERIEVPSATPAAIRKRLDEVRALAGDRHDRAAFVMLWSLLEAVVRGVEDQDDGPLTPGTIVQSLVMNGLLDPEAERPVRDLIALRNRIVHGDVHAEPTIADIELMLAAVDEALSAEAA